MSLIFPHVTAAPSAREIPTGRDGIGFAAEIVKSYLAYVQDPTRGCTVVAHRGLWKDAPENSLRAIEEAADAGCKVVKVDVQRSADGEFFLLHNDLIDWMTGHHGLAADMTMDELSRLRLFNCNGGKGDPLTQERIPSLREVFELILRLGIYLHLDVKDPGHILDVIALAKEMGVDRQVGVWADLETDEDFRQIREIMSTGVLCMPRIDVGANNIGAVLVRLFELKPAVCELRFENLGQITTLREEFKNEGIAIWVDTCDGSSAPGFSDSEAIENPQAVWGALIEAGVSFIQTDWPDTLNDFLAQRATA
ncbi:glycerophosphodiester phosphodiesterase family protein [Rhizobium terrae]|uniref:glycerophosphodiester phosphodiesterase family protein n=1 Tax=Rhizobium terrae TaxID=2171756 RepID=UPI000E3C81CE|nr:glycerophosphodiester phosphodiesterase family protein [Rhizobium terrae]